jgi:hypothetical protein
MAAPIVSLRNTYTPALSRGALNVLAAWSCSGEASGTEAHPDASAVNATSKKPTAFRAIAFPLLQNYRWLMGIHFLFSGPM